MQLTEIPLGETAWAMSASDYKTNPYRGVGNWNVVTRYWSTRKEAEADARSMRGWERVVRQVTHDGEHVVNRFGACAKNGYTHGPIVAEWKITRRNGQRVLARTI
jgi:hypothetical protein